MRQETLCDQMENAGDAKELLRVARAALDELIALSPPPAPPTLRSVPDNATAADADALAKVSRSTVAASRSMLPADQAAADAQMREFWIRGQMGAVITRFVGAGGMAQSPEPLDAYRLVLAGTLARVPEAGAVSSWARQELLKVDRASMGAFFEAQVAGFHALDPSTPADLLEARITFRAVEAALTTSLPQELPATGSDVVLMPAAQDQTAHSGPSVPGPRAAAGPVHHAGTVVPLTASSSPQHAPTTRAAIGRPQTAGVVGPVLR